MLQRQKRPAREWFYKKQLQIIFSIFEKKLPGVPTSFLQWTRNWYFVTFYRMTFIKWNWNCHCLDRYLECKQTSDLVNSCPKLVGTPVKMEQKMAKLFHLHHWCFHCHGIFHRFPWQIGHLHSTYPFFTFLILRKTRWGA